MSVLDTNADKLRSYTQEEIQSMLRECQNLYCPFCGEFDFDRIGLKSHITFHCDSFRDVSTLRDERGILV
jgi:transposase-like protein